jgi:hypothetical protein
MTPCLVVLLCWLGLSLTATAVWSLLVAAVRSGWLR